MEYANPARLPALTSCEGYVVTVSSKTSWVFVRLVAEDGAEGWGEATHFGAEAEIGGLVDGLDASLLDAPAASATALAARLRQSDMGGPRRALVSAIEQAGVALIAGRAGAALTDILGGAERQSVPFYANINRGITDRSPEGFAAQAARTVAETDAAGIKIAPFDGYHHARSGLADAEALIERGLGRVAAVREAVPDRLLLVDCHARFDPFAARRMMSGLALHDVWWVEEPCEMGSLSPRDQRALRGVANDNGIRLAGGETVSGLGEMADLIEAGGHDVVLPDLRETGIAGGIAMLRLAAARQVGVSLHNPVGPVLDAVSIAVAACLPAFLILERQVGETPLFDALRGDPVPVSEGHVPSVPAVVPPITQLQPLGRAAPAKLSFAGQPGAGPDA